MGTASSHLFAHVGTDFCRPMLEIAAGKTSDRIPLIEGDALDLPFRDGAFEVVAIVYHTTSAVTVCFRPLLSS